MNNKLLFLIFNLFISLNLIKSFEYVSVQFSNTECKGEPVVIYSSSECSTLGYYKSVSNDSIYIGNGIKSISDCNPPPQNGYNNQLKVCSDGFKSYFNSNGSISLPDGYCGEVQILPGGNCSSNLALISYKNGVCIGDNSKYFRYQCDGKVANRYKCATDCTVTTSHCEFDKQLDSIDKCPSIQVKSLTEITGDKSIPTPEPTKPNTNGTSTGGSNNNPSTTGGNNNGENTGQGDNGNHSTILSINILFISLLSVLLLLK